MKMQVTEEVIRAAIKPRESGGGDNVEERQAADYSEKDLEKFMKRVYPMIDSALSLKIKSLERTTILPPFL